VLERLHYILGGCVGEGTHDSDSIFIIIFSTRGNPLVAQNLQKKITKFVWQWTVDLLWPVRHKQNHHAAKPN